MIFNIVSGGLNLRDNGSFVSKESYILTIVNIILCVLVALQSMPECYYAMKNKSRNTSKIYCMYVALILAFNIVFSVEVIKYYTDKKVIDKTMHDLSMSIVVIDSFYTIQLIGYSM